LTLKELAALRIALFEEPQIEDSEPSATLLKKTAKVLPSDSWLTVQEERVAVADTNEERALAAIRRVGRLKIILIGELKGWEFV